MRRTLFNRLAVAVTAAMLALTALAGPAFALALATNDNFANATVIAPGSLPYFNEVNAGGATAEGGEVGSIRCSMTYSETIWYRITPNFNGALRADTIGMNSGQLTVYTGSSLGSLNEVACNAGSATDDTSSARVAWKVSKGTTYHIRISKADDDTILHLYRVTRPANDDFGNARSVTSLPLKADTSLMNATFQYAEPDSGDLPGCSAADPTIWYTIRPTSNMVIRASVYGTADTVLAVYKGTSLGSLTAIGCNDDTSVEGQGLASNVSWRAKAGVRYYVQVGGYEGETGPVHVTIARGHPPANDQFKNAIAINASDTAVNHVPSTRDATMQLSANEPDPSNCAMAGSVWYSFTPGVTGTYVVDVSSDEFNTTIAVYTGTSLSTLSPVNSQCGGTGMTFGATMGTKYWIQIGGNGGDTGDVHMRLYDL